MRVLLHLQKNQINSRRFMRRLKKWLFQQAHQHEIAYLSWRWVSEFTEHWLARSPFAVAAASTPPTEKVVQHCHLVEKQYWQYRRYQNVWILLAERHAIMGLDYGKKFATMWSFLSEVTHVKQKTNSASEAGPTVFVTIFRRQLSFKCSCR